MSKVKRTFTVALALGAISVPVAHADAYGKQDAMRKNDAYGLRDAMRRHDAYRLGDAMRPGDAYRRHDAMRRHDVMRLTGLPWGDRVAQGSSWSH